MEQETARREDHDRQLILLAGLLHDIGKFFQRADDSGVHRSKQLNQDIKNAESTYCPVRNDGNRSHKHVIWTAQFIKSHHSIFKNLFKQKQSGVKTSTGESLEALASAHHTPNGFLQNIIKEADHCSSGMDRGADINMKDVAHESNDWESFKDTRMCSVFEGVRQEVENEDDFEWSPIRLPVRELSLSTDKAWFPKESFDNQARDDYKSLWESFDREFQNIPTRSFEGFVETLLALLHKYAVNVPSSTQDLPDVSLYEHLRSTAAFSVCIYDYLKEQGKDALKEKDEPFLFVGGDLSGVQDFIYNILSKNASKNLKGRSFYLQLLVDAVIRKFLHQEGLTTCNIVYSSGGGFYLIFPNTKGVQDRVQHFQHRIEKELFDDFDTKLFLAVDAIPFRKLDLIQEDDKGLQYGMKRLWMTLTEKLNKKKQNRYTTQLIDNYEKFFKPIEAGGEKDRDAITNEELPEGKDNIKYLEKDSDGKEYYPVNKQTTWQQIQLGSRLPNSKHILELTQPLSREKIGNKHFEIQPIEGVQEVLLGNEGTIQQKDASFLRSINDLDFLPQTNGNPYWGYGFTYYGGDSHPQVEGGNGEPKTFDQLAKGEEGQFQRLGFLRMDVDNLGQVFTRGFREDRRTFSRYSTLSEGLDRFFKGYLNELWKKNQDYKDYSYIIYSGGDDLFIVGDWKVTIEMAEQIRNDFREWVCYNPYLTLSGGVAILPPKFPVHYAAVQAAEMEKKAKDHNDEEKDAFTLLGYPLNWEKEFPIVKRWKEKLLSFIESGALSKGLLGKIGGYAELKQHQEKEGDNPSWRWRMAYDLSRLKKGTKNNEAGDLIETLEKSVFCNVDETGKPIQSNYQFIDLLNVAARWAEMEYRRNQ